MKILSALIVSEVKSDVGLCTVVLTTDLPNPEYPYVGTLVLRFQMQRGKAKDYVYKHFGVEPDFLT